MLKGRVLLLNGSFEVLGTIGVARAIRMTLRKENPVIVQSYVPDTYLTSAGGTKFPVPSVISLRHHVDIRKRRRESDTRREKIFIRDRYSCQYCPAKVGKFNKAVGRKLEVKDLTIDHILPKSQNGKNIPTNLVTACGPCNRRKANRTPEQANMPLKTEIHDTANIGLDKIMLCRYVENRPDWLPFLQMQEGFTEILEKMELV